jgi:hypothetical protein
MNQAPTQWGSGEEISRSYAIDEAALFRFARRGMLGAQWEPERNVWVYDLQRVAELFLPRGTRVARDLTQFGVLGSTTLVSVKSRQPPVQKPRRKELSRELQVKVSGGCA